MFAIPYITRTAIKLQISVPVRSAFNDSGSSVADCSVKLRILWVTESTILFIQLFTSRILFMHKIRQSEILRKELESSLEAVQFQYIAYTESDERSKKTVLHARFY